MGCFRTRIDPHVSFAQGVEYWPRRTFGDGTQTTMKDSVEQKLRRACTAERAGRSKEAIALYEQILKKYPKNVKAQKALGALRKKTGAVSGNVVTKDHLEHLMTLLRQNQPEVLLNLFKSLDLSGPYASVALNLAGAAHSRLENYQEAIACYQQALELHPGYVEALYNLAKAQQDLGALEDAAKSYERVLRLKPDLAWAHYNLGNIARARKDHHVAVEHYRSALEIEPGLAWAHYNLSLALTDLREYTDALQSCDHALKLMRGGDQLLAHKLNLHARLCDWAPIRENAHKMPALGISGEAVTPFAMLAMDDDPARQLQRARKYSNERYPGEPLAPPARPKARPDRLKIGYFSADFHNHPSMHLLARVYELHDKDRFEVYAYSSGRDSDDEYRQRLLKSVDKFKDIKALSDKEAAGLVRQDRLDIAIDLSGFTKGSRHGLFKRRPAPLSVNYLGFPGTLGAKCFDYIIGDQRVIPEEARQYFDEKVIYLPHCYMPSDDTKPISEKEVSRTDEGLPEEGFVFCCFNNSYKLQSREFDIWMRLLQRIEGSVLWLQDFGETPVQNLRAEAVKRGINLDRLIFARRLPLDEHLARLKLADLFLDTFNYNAHTTASDACWAGLPVLTLAGKSFAARVASSILHTLDLPELITETEEAYEEKAQTLATRPFELQRYRARLASCRLSSPFFSSEIYTRHLEDAYDTIWERYASDHSVDHVFIDD